jgi:hypothetical protein
VGEVAKGGSEGDPHIPGARVLGFGVVDDHGRDVPFCHHANVGVIGGSAGGHGGNIYRIIAEPSNW